MKMNVLKKGIALMLVAVFVFMAIASGEPEVKLPDNMSALKIGERMSFSVEALSDITWVAEKEKTNINLKFDTVGFSEFFDYYNCKISGRYSATVIYEDMTEEKIDESWVLNLPFSGTETFKIKLEQENKKIHAIYDEEFEFETFSGEIIKKK